MEEKEVLKSAIRTITDEPILPFTYNVKPPQKSWYEKALFRLGITKPKKQERTLYSLTAGNRYRVSKTILEIPEAAIKTGTDSVLRDMYNLFANHHRKVAYIVAVSCVNSKEEPSESLINELIENIPEKQLRLLALEVVKDGNISDFTNTMVLIIGMDIITPRETSPLVPGASLEDL